MSLPQKIISQFNQNALFPQTMPQPSQQIWSSYSSRDLVQSNHIMPQPSQQTWSSYSSHDVVQSNHIMPQPSQQTWSSYSSHDFYRADARSLDSPYSNAYNTYVQSEYTLDTIGNSTENMVINH